MPKARKTLFGHDPFSAMKTIMNREKWQQDHGLGDRRRKFLFSKGWTHHHGHWVHPDDPNKDYGLTAATKRECLRWYECRLLEVVLWAMRDLEIVDCSTTGPDGKPVPCDLPRATPGTPEYQRSLDIYRACGGVWPDPVTRDS